MTQSGTSLPEKLAIVWRRIEAVEGGQASEGATAHFVVGVQWHPERSYDISPASRALFDRFIAEAAAWVPRPVHTSVA